MARSKLLLVSLLSVSALFAGGCLHQDVEAPGLGLKRVVIYRNGVGYFERAGKVDADEVNFRVRREKVGDFLATLAVVEQGGSSVRSASFPIMTDEEASEEVDEPEPEPVAGKRRYDIDVSGPPQPKKKVKTKGDELQRVRLSLDGKEHDLVVGYVAETPVWRPSYRLVIGDSKGSDGKPTADLQAWGIVQNLTGEDWKGVRLSLVAGAPLAFQSTLDQPVIPQRPIVTDQGEVISSVPTGETSYAEAPPPPAAPMPSVADEAEEDSDWDEGYNEKAEADALAIGGGASAMGRAARSKATAPSSARRPAPAQRPASVPSYTSAPSAPRRVNALANVAIEGATTRYDLPFAVDVPNKSATMVLLLSRKVAGQSIFLFAPDGGVGESSFHPFRVARFVNQTSGLLERGPIAIYEKGAFLGQGLVEPLPPGASATVPFALERGVSVSQSRDSDQQGSRLAKLESGRMEIERDQVILTKYQLKNGLDEEVTLLVKHPRTPGTRLNNAPKQTEDNTGTNSALVPHVLGKRASGELIVDERSSFRVGVDPLSQLADDAVRGYLADTRADATVAAQLRAAWDVRKPLKAAMDERSSLETERAEIERTSDQLRQNLQAIKKNEAAGDLRRDLTARLAKASARYDEIEKRAITLGLTIAEQSIRFRDALNAIKLTTALPPK